MKQANRSYTVLKIKTGHQYYNWCELACLQSRYLYNSMLYEYRNSYFDKDIKNLTNTELYRIGTLVVGKNKEWKQEVNIGSKNNQSFTMIPHARFIDLITYKFESVGGIVKLVNEAYTSKCSALDLEPICKQTEYKGKRVKRGLFKSSKGVMINADINGSLNILRKVCGDTAINAVGNDFISDSIESPQWASQSLIKITL